MARSLFDSLNAFIIKRHRWIIALIMATILLATIAVVSAYVYETGQPLVTQTIKNIATLTVSNSALGNIEEGQTLTYSKTGIPTLGAIVSLTTTKNSVYLYFSSNIDALATYYSTYNITVIYAAVGTGSTHGVGDIACTMTIGAPTPASVTLDKAGTWSFDFELTTTAKSVSADQPTTATITVNVEST